jgi:hypothetical protein
MSQDEKLDEALKGTFPASDPFYLSPDETESAGEKVQPHGVRAPMDEFRGRVTGRNPVSRRN